MRYEFIISLRYLRAKRKQVLLSVITLISISGVALGVTALLVTLSVMNGFKTDLTNKILGTYAHITVLHQSGQGISDYKATQQKLEAVPRVVAAAPFVYGQIMLKSEVSIMGAVVKGIDPDGEARITELSSNITEGDISVVRSPGNIILGSELARNLGVGLGEDIFLISPMGVVSAFGIMPTMKKFTVSGIFNSGMYEYDANLSYVSLESAQGLFNLHERVTGIALKTDDAYKAQDISEAIQADMGFPFMARSWMVTNRNLFSALELEKMTMFVILVLIILVAAFNIVATLMMMTMEKTKDIGILKAMGATRKHITRIFVMEGLIIGVIGTLLGCIGGFVLSKLLDVYQFVQIPSDVYYLDRLPVHMQLGDFVIVAVSAIIISMIATIYPSLRAGRLDPCESIRYE
ncbi:MAG: lipoprotein-releasing ABC transporter permease subunit [bacterium]